MLESLLDLRLLAGVAVLLEGLLALGVLFLLLVPLADALEGVADFLPEAAAFTGSVLLDLASDDRAAAFVVSDSFLVVRAAAFEILPTDLAYTTE